MEVVLDSIYNTAPSHILADTTIYSDIGIIILGKVIESISGLSLGEFSRQNIFKPLGMNTTMYNPPQEKLHRVVPTEISKNNILIKGFVHDENALRLRGSCRTCRFIFNS